MTRAAVGVDVGGTSIKTGLIDDSGHVLFRTQVETPPKDSSPDRIVDAIIEVGMLARAAAERADATVDGFGFGLPEYSVGPDWVQRQSGNLPALEGFALRPPLCAAFGPSIACDLDTHASTGAELHFGAGGVFRRFIFVCIGTGISCGIVVDGELLRYTFGTSGDTGHVIVDPTGAKRCTCGGSGCLEAYTGGWAIREAGIAKARSGASPALTEVYSQRRDLTARDVADAAKRGDRAAGEIMDRAGRALGIALTTLMNIYLPEAILLGGGVSGAGDLLIEPAQAAIAELAAPFYADHLKELRVGAFGSEAGIIGAAALVLFGRSVSAS